MEPDDKRASPVRDHCSDLDSDTDKSDEATTVHDTQEDLSQSPLTPPHWLHHRRESYASVIETRPPPIVLEDHTEGPSAEDDIIWAKAIYIEDYAVISGNLPSVGSFIVWHCKIDTVNGGAMIIRKRYSEFHDFRGRLLLTFPNSGGAMPPFPPKSILRSSASVATFS